MLIKLGTNFHYFMVHVHVFRLLKVASCSSKHVLYLNLRITMDLEYLLSLLSSLSVGGFQHETSATICSLLRIDIKFIHLMLPVSPFRKLHPAVQSLACYTSHWATHRKQAI
jgi:hypothetical protein